VAGKFIVIEGPDGCGKSTQIDLLWRWLYEVLDNPPLKTSEPGGTPLGLKLRELILDPSLEMSPLTQTFLLCAARAQHCERIKQCLEKDVWVVCDRFSESTKAYQGTGEDLPTNVIYVLDQISRGDYDPYNETYRYNRSGVVADLTIVLSLPWDEAVRRSGGSDRFESKGADFKRRVAKAYEGFSGRDWWVQVDGSGSEEEVFERIKKVITEKVIEAELL
jgi:dTMP kinase